MTVRYIGSGPYCYANSLAMVMGARAHDPSAIEVLTGSPFGATFIAGLPYFSPAGWNPDIGLTLAIEALGWRCERSAGGDAAAAIGRLREACQDGPVLVGPVELGLLSYMPGQGTPIGSDHFVVVLTVDDATVTLHDPHGHPHATLPLPAFVAAWRAETVPYPSTPFTMRAGFQRVRDVDPERALRGWLPDAVRWLDGSPGAGATVERIADLVTADLDAKTHGHLVHFAVRVGARRLADTSAWLGRIGRSTAAEIADVQARLLGGVQYDLVAGDHLAAAAALRKLAPTYAALRAALGTPS
ncbi:hypothetical protein K1W54_35300 [Micromonospora sp. CPCC 205371]|nr:hypothetical protein [Micromonospora sp. CPCC 205371]